MINGLDLPSNPDVIPAEGIVEPGRLAQIQKHFGASAKIVVTMSVNESIPRPLRASDMPNGLPTIGRPMVIGVMVGAPSGNLVAVGFRRKEYLARFFEANQALQGSLVTIWNALFLSGWSVTSWPEILTSQKLYGRRVLSTVLVRET